MQVDTQRCNVKHRGKVRPARLLTVSSVLPMPLADAWERVQMPALLQFVARGMIRFLPLDSLPQRWKAGQTYRVRMRLFGFLPFGGVHHLHVESVDAGSATIQTREWNAMIPVWQHRIRLRAVEGGVHYEDRILIYAGLLSLPVTLFASFFYRHRQRRWQLVARGLPDAAAPGGGGGGDRR